MGAVRFVFKLSAKRRGGRGGRPSARLSSALNLFSKPSPSIKMETSVLRMEDEES
mgnify:CR=1 FL=1